MTFPVFEIIDNPSQIWLSLSPGSWSYYNHFSAWRRDRESYEEMLEACVAGKLTEANAQRILENENTKKRKRMQDVEYARRKRQKDRKDKLSLKNKVQTLKIENQALQEEEKRLSRLLKQAQERAAQLDKITATERVTSKQRLLDQLVQRKMLQERLQEKMMLEAARLKSATAMLPTVSPMLHRELGHRPLSLYSDLLRSPMPIPDPYAAAAGQLRAATAFNSSIGGDHLSAPADIDSEIMKLLSLRRTLATVGTTGLSTPTIESGILAARDWKVKIGKPWPFLG